MSLADACDFEDEITVELLMTGPAFQAVLAAARRREADRSHDCLEPESMASSADSH